MSARVKLKKAASAIDDAKRSLKRAAYNVENDYDIRKAIRELDSAETEIKRALREIE
ncbi:hypothetical protein KO533_18990 [Shewanella sp. NKUCC05_KAH]|uniref:hypothetical protein n=1 Tax=Shewanella TaxID=22 RepID=UPI0001E4DCAA|nr:MULTISPECIES: hypothetical protein [Shewanella]AEG13592.1 hypothetical protein Sbal175_4380 [Shewanella baltica BA175]MBW3528639.1 hypothetical protein [Shewanella sp. NKUCC05_KAH]MCS6129996.1 hypothetical protein [Shewanella baltica]MCS6141910.1 hypothetical protein [Shewanella baltica]MCS6148245.1 hypothetical protein [Shewanella baltica]